MGNCQAIDAATLLIQHPSGKVEKLYWAVSAREVMKMNPGHYVALLISTTMLNQTTSAANSVRLTRIKLLRPADTLVLGQVYRLITSQEVMRGLSAKKQAKVKKNQSEAEDKMKQHTPTPTQSDTSDPHHLLQATKQEKKNQRERTSTSTASGTGRSRTWQPSLHSISEAGS